MLPTRPRASAAWPHPPCRRPSWPHRAPRSTTSPVLPSPPMPSRRRLPAASSRPWASRQTAQTAPLPLRRTTGWAPSRRSTRARSPRRWTWMWPWWAAALPVWQLCAASPRTAARWQPLKRLTVPSAAAASMPSSTAMCRPSGAATPGPVSRSTRSWTLTWWKAPTAASAPL